MESIRKKAIVSLSLLYVILIGIKIALAYFVQSPIEFADGYVYAKMAREIFHSNIVEVFSQIGYPPLYSLLLAPAYALGSMPKIYFAMKVINAIISSLIIFPTYLLAKEFLNVKKSLFITAIVALLASNLNISNYIMAENLFYPLFLFSVYFVYKSLLKGGYSYPIFAGIFIGLTVMTKILGVVLIPLSIVLFLFYRKKLYLKFTNQIVHYFSIMLILLPYFLNIALKSSSNSTSSNASSIYSIIFNGLIRDSSFYLKVLGYLNWYLLYFAYIILASGILFGFFFLIGKSLKEEKFRILYSSSWILIVLTIFGIISAFSGFVAGIFDSRIIGRYISNLLPLVLVLGYAHYDQMKPELNVQKGRMLWFTLFFVFIVGLMMIYMFTLLPMNNQDVAYLGLIKYGMEILGGGSRIYIAIIYGLFIGLLGYICRKLEYKRIIGIAVVILMANTILAASMTIYNSHQWAKSEQYEAGMWLDKYDPDISHILIQEEGAGKINRELKYLYEYTPKSGYISYIGFWLNDELYFEDTDKPADYIITKEKIDKELLYETSGKLKIKVYRA